MDTRKSVITSDMEGRIQTFNEAAEEIFGYQAEEVVGKKRVSLFSPGPIVLGHVGDWLATADEEGEYVGKTVFVRKDGSKFAARIRITPTWKDKEAGERLGYCGVTEPLEDVEPEEVMPEVGLLTSIFRWLVITRAPFLTAALVPVSIGTAWAAFSGASFPWWQVALAAIGGAALQVAANTFNDYFDWRSGTDPANNDYFQALSGGSRAIELGLISEQGTYLVGAAAALVAALVGGVFTLVSGTGILLFGLAGLFSSYFYTAPPLRLVARRGLGELLIGLNFGPLMVAGTVYALTGSVSTMDFLVGLPIGLLTTAILWINEFPDAEADAATGKEHLVVVLGKDLARWGYLLLLVGAYGLIAVGVALGVAPAWTLLAYLGLPFAARAVYHLFKHMRSRELVSANASTILTHLISGVALAVGLFIGG
ncbi:MAG: UbiA family prenyltransferase [Anaerolineales bacterium]